MRLRALGGEARAVAFGDSPVGIGSPIRMVTVPASYMPGSERQHFARSFECDIGTSGTPALMAMNAAPSLKSPMSPVSRPSAFGKNEQRNALAREPPAPPASWFSPPPAHLPRDPDVARARQMPSQERNLKQPAFGQKPETAPECSRAATGVSM